MKTHPKKTHLEKIARVTAATRAMVALVQALTALVQALTPWWMS